MVSTRAGGSQPVDGLPASVTEGTGENQTRGVPRPTSARLPPTHGNLRGPQETPVIEGNNPTMETMMQTITALQAQVQRLEQEANERRNSSFRTPTIEVNSVRRSGDEHSVTPVSREHDHRSHRRDDRRDDRGHYRRDDRVGCTYKNFLACKPPEYRGGADPTVSLRWLRGMEETFEAARCANEEKVTYATRCLVDKAQDWWIARKTALGTEAVRGLSWEMFSRYFTEDYCTSRDVDKLERELLNLKKGKMTITQYADQFVAKMRFAVRVVPDEAARVKQFVEGLPFDYRGHVRKMTTLNAAIQEAKTIEDDLQVKEQEKKESSHVGDKRKFESSSGSSKKFKSGGHSGKKTVAATNVEKCRSCGTTHTGECTAATRKCFNCGQSGHMGRECELKEKVFYTCKEPGI